jgi:ATP-dependent DNA helicase DinG
LNASCATRAGAFVAVDFETTGLDPETDRIIELGAVRYREGSVVGSYHRLVNPGRPLPWRVAQLTGLSDATLEAQPGIREALPGFVEFIGQDRVIGHNLSFDLGFLVSEMRRAGMRPLDLGATGLDTLSLARALMPARPGHSLGTLVSELGLADGDERRHRALDDAAASGRLLLWLYAHAATYAPAVLRAARDWLAPAREQMRGLSDFVDEVLERPAAAARRPAATPGGSVPSPDLSLPCVARGGLASLLPELFEPGGLLSRVLAGFEPRPQQARMAQAIARVLGAGGTLAVEAGTGIGKSLAYLAPALAVAEGESEKVVVSTNTITLQDQLVERDLPLLSAALGRPVRFATLKGRPNYLCMRKWYEELGAALTADTAERLFVLRVLFWQATTETGDNAELNLMGEEDALWRLVSGDEGCWGSACPYSSRCYLTRARQRAEQADLVIANHALVCANLAAGGRLLPEHRRLIIDEAHHFEAVATDHLGLSVRRGELVALIGGASGRGFRAPRVLAAPGQQGWPSEAELSELAVASQRAQAAARTLFDGIAAAVGELRGPGDLESSSLQIPYREGMQGLPEGTFEVSRTAWEALGRLGRLLGAVAGRAPADAAAAAEVANLARAVSLQAAALDALGRADQKDWVYWLEDGPGGHALCGAPIDVGPILRERLWPELHSAALVSATLAVMERFDHTLGRLGLGGGSGDDRPGSLLLRSPFDYRRQALLCVPTDLPEPGAGGGEGDRSYVAAAAEYLADLLPAVGGRALALFTSYRMLRQVYAKVAAELAGRGLNVLAQGIDGGRTRLLRALRTEERVVVFGTSTFWEGIDVRGPQLSCLVIARLPFPRPDDPLVAARQDRLEREGQSSFAHYSLPQAVLRLKQGFGRLIRSGEDHGAVVILDGRLLRRQYGRVFLDSLPEATRYYGPSAQTIARVTSWLQGDGATGVRWVDDRRPSEV